MARIRQGYALSRHHPKLLLSQSNQYIIKLVLKQPLLPAQLALLPQKNLFNPIDSTIHIEMDRISKL